MNANNKLPRQHISSPPKALNATPTATENINYILDDEEDAVATTAEDDDWDFSNDTPIPGEGL